jgi:hypothetical protein
MRIFEIIEPKTIIKQREKPFDPVYLDTQRLKHQVRYHDDYPGRGLYSKGRGNIQDPHMFTKITVKSLPLEHDPYYNYVKAIEPYISSNPYLPRVYVTKVVKDQTGKVFPKYQIEKLFTLDQISGNDSELRQELLNTLYKKLIRDPKPEDPIFLFKIIRSALQQNDFSRIKDSLLRQALSIIRDLVSKNYDDFDFDLHDGNFLFRTGPNGVQMVLADPLIDANLI